MVNSTDDPIHVNNVWEICHFYMEEIRMVAGFPSNVYYINYIVGVIFNIFLAISTIFLNSVTILAYRRSAFLRSKKAYFLIMLLSVNDLLVGLFGNGSFVLLLLTIIIGYRKCEIYAVLIFTSFCLPAMSVMTLFGLNIERYLSILHPIYHRTKVTKSKLLKMIVGFWLLMITARSFYIVFGKIMKIVLSVVLVFIAFSTLYIYASIYVTTRRRVPDMQTTEVRGAWVRASIRRTNQIYEIQNIRMTKSCGIVVGLTFLCNVPYAVANSLPTSDILSLLGLWSTTSGLGASSFNSLVFFWNNPVLRKEARKLFKKPRPVI